MGNITEYSATNNQIPQPNEQAASVAMHSGTMIDRFARQKGDALGGAIKNVGGQIGEQIDNHIAGQQIAQGMTMYSFLQAQHSKNISETMNKAPLADTSVGQGLRESTQKDWQNFYDQYASASPKAQEWAQRTMENGIRESNNSITAYEMQRAGALVNQGEDLAQKSAMASVYFDPTSLDAKLTQREADHESLMSTHGANVAPGAAETFNGKLLENKQQIVMSAFAGKIRQNPDEALKELTTGAADPYLKQGLLTPGQVDQLTNEAHKAKFQAMEDADRMDAFQKRQAEDVALQKTDQYLTDIKNGVPGTLKKAWADPAFQKFPHMIENINAFSQAQRDFNLRMSNESNPVALRNLMTSMHDQYVKDPNNVSDKPIWDALKAKQINYTDFERAEQTFKGLDKPVEQSWNRQLRTFESSFKNSAQGQALAMSDPSGYASKINQIDSDFHAQLSEYQHTGKDVNTLLDPKTGFLAKQAPNYFGGQGQQLKQGADNIRAGEQTPEAQARAAIAAGADKAKVSARYKQMTGKDLE